MWQLTVRPNDSATVRSSSWVGVLWTIVIALDFFWLSNPIVFMNFTDSLRNACAVTLGALLLTPMRRFPRLPWTVVAVVTFLFLTILWSMFSRFTVHVALLYLAIAVVGLAIAASVDARTMAHGMALGGVVIVVLSFYANAIDLPGAGTLSTPGEGYFAGVGANRNVLSYTLVLSLAFAISFFPRTWPGRALWLAGTGTVALGIYLTESASGLVAAIALVGAAIALGWRDRVVARTDDPAHRVSTWVRLLPVVTIVAAVVVLQVLVRVTGRDSATFSGRSPLWAATWHAADGWDRWVGAGWGVVWQHPWFPAGPNQIYTDISARAGIELVHGHNSFFDLLPEVGIIGALLFAAAYGQAIARGLYARRISAAPDADELAASRGVLLTVLALLVYGITEPLSTIPLGWWLLAILATGLAPRSRPVRYADAEPAADDAQPTAAGSGKRAAR